ncbi:BLUF domain-containing protein [Sphingomonas montanisoli]|uniref:BLUF domain-containing protein n=1 Tax=Sphingomonas montanisoli TaxID=2606412 RepID=A0A5D9C2S0_9SPHN|nr:BLUF domain-containing protein [Sphingomonas montanisoli]TZG25733.1 BLUF domain-containing protein [Sphingomonas montanisoli]
MLQLTYISTAAPSLSIYDAETILEVSRRNNARAGVSGLLVFDGKRFLQALEGDQAAVEHTFARIREDVRHRAIVELSRRTVEIREFGPWAMASEVVGPIIGKGDIVGTVIALTETIPDANVRELFRGFAKIRAA